MRSVFWFLFLAAVAVALAMLMGDNQASVTLFWHPYRVDVSFNLVLFVLVFGFALLYGAMRGLSVLRRLPEQAHRWRAHQTERAIYTNVLDALAYQLSGRFVRAQSAAERAIDLLQHQHADTFVHHDQVLVLARLLAAESAHSVGNLNARDVHLRGAVEGDAARASGPAREGALLRAAGWAVDAREAAQAARWLGELPQGASRRIQAVRLKLKLARLTQDTHGALDMVRLLAKHRAFSSGVAQSLRRGLVLDALRDSHDSAQLLKVWQALDSSEQATPELSLAVLDRWDALDDDVRSDAGGDVRRMLDDALQRVWDAYGRLDDDARRRFVLRLEAALPTLDASWLARIERAQREHPADLGLQYLAGQAFMQRELWGKASALLTQASHGLKNAELARRTWCSLARLAEERGDSAAAQAAWKKAALV